MSKRRQVTPESPGGDEEEYDENADEDFDPDAAHGDGDDALSSSSEDDDPTETRPSNKDRPTTKKRKVTVVDIELDSGDEATIRERKRKKQKSYDDGPDPDEDGSGPEGLGLIRTRAQRRTEKAERKQQRRTAGGAVTIDVDQIWEDLKNLPIGRSISMTEISPETSTEDKGEEEVKREKAAQRPGEKIKIKRRIEYAGQITEIEEEVSRDSNEAIQYLREHPEVDQSQPDKSSTDSTTSTSNLQRPLKRLSIFEPNPACIVKGVPPERLRQRAPSRQDVLLMEQRAEELRKKKAEKMTTVQKSALDWRSYVDQQGLSDELSEYGKSRSTFLGREEFLDRAQGARDERAREARLKA